MIIKPGEFCLNRSGKDCKCLAFNPDGELLEKNCRRMFECKWTD